MVLEKRREKGEVAISREMIDGRRKVWLHGCMQRWRRKQPGMGARNRVD